MIDAVMGGFSKSLITLLWRDTLPLHKSDQLFCFNLFDELRATAPVKDLLPNHGSIFTRFLIQEPRRVEHRSGVHIVFVGHRYLEVSMLELFISVG